MKAKIKLDLVKSRMATYSAQLADITARSAALKELLDADTKEAAILEKEVAAETEKAKSDAAKKTS